MEQSDIKKATKGTLTKEIATRQTDPSFYGALSFLPNPDEVLRKLGKGQEAYDAIIYDAHVMSELRSIRSGMLSFETRLQPASDSPADMRAWDLCNQWMNKKPAPGMLWSDVIWNMAQAVFRGFAVHEVVWKRHGNLLMPERVIDKPQRRFVFGTDNELRLRSKDSMYEGDELGQRKWLLTRHMPSYDNPYGVAVFSACFWPYVFKHNGFKWFSKFCEKYGIPWAIGKHPRGTPEPERQEFLNQLEGMIEDAIGTIPDDGSVELLTVSSSGQLPQDRLIQVANSEMSKALTSQTLATEIQGEGSRAASETHREREKSGNETDRDMVCDTMNQLLAWITEINIPGANPPRHEFYEEADAQNEFAEFFSEANQLVDIPVAHVYDRLQIPQPKDGEDIIPRGSAKPKSKAPEPPPEFSRCPSCGGAHDFNQAEDDLDRLVEQAAEGADKIIEAMANPIKQLLVDFEKDGKSLQDFQSALMQMYPGMDEDRLAEHTRDVLLIGLLKGVEEAV